MKEETANVTAWANFAVSYRSGVALSFTGELNFAVLIPLLTITGLLLRREATGNYVLATGVISVRAADSGLIRLWHAEELAEISVFTRLRSSRAKTF